MPVVFVGHGSPMNIIEKNRFTKTWSEIALQIPEPKAILCVSAHWYTEGQYISTNPQPQTIYDFYGFPKDLYRIVYPAKGEPEIAQRVKDLLGDDVQTDAQQGLDHGAWSVLKFMFPKANIPVLQLSVDRLNSAEESYKIGQKLKILREEGVLVVGSGDVVHNLRLVSWDKENGYDWADSFDEYIKKAILSYDIENIINYQNAGEEEQKSFYFRDHFDPLLYCLGSVDKEDKVEIYNDERVMGALSMTSYLWKE